MGSAPLAEPRGRASSGLNASHQPTELLALPDVQSRATEPYCPRVPNPTQDQDHPCKWHTPRRIISNFSPPSRAKKAIGWASLHTPTRSSCREISHPGRIATVEILHSFNETRFELCRTTVDGSEGKLRSAAEFATMRSVSSKRIPKGSTLFLFMRGSL